MLPYGRQTIDDDDIEAVVAALKGDFLTTGPYVDAFEEALCHVTGAKYAVACSNGTTALHLACLAMGLQSDDAVIVPTLTFLATANAPRYCGAHVVFSDVDADTGLMSAQNFLDALQRAQDQNLSVKAVFPVHLAGQPVDLKAIQEIAATKNISVIADSCHAIGGAYQGSGIGACQFEDMATFSFHPVKTIAMGEGGAVTTNNKDYADAMRRLRHHGMMRGDDMAMWEYDMPNLGYNYRLTDIQCALGVSQLKKLEGFVARREELAQLYDKALQGVSPYIRPPQRVQDSKTSWHLYAPRIDFDALGMSRQDVMGALKEKNIGTQVHYIPVHSQPYYTGLYGHQDLPGAQHYYERTLSLPLYPAMKDKDVRYVVDVLQNIAGKKAERA